MWYDHKGRYDHNVLTPNRRVYSFRSHDYGEGSGVFDQARQGIVTREGYFVPIESIDAIKLSFFEWLRSRRWGTNLRTTEKYLGRLS